MDEIDVPLHFLCPISLQLMKDPVTVSTGITYDRDNIETWLFSCKNNTCPVTKQVINQDYLTPNHTLLRLIQSWCSLNGADAIQRIPTPKPPPDKSQIAKLIEEAKSSLHSQLKCLTKLKSIALESDKNRNFLQQSGVIEFLVSVIRKESQPEFMQSSEEALSILYHLRISDTQLKNLQGEFLQSLLRIMKHGNYQSRAYSTMLLNSILKTADPQAILTLPKDIFFEVTNVLRDRISHQATKAALKLLIEVCPWGRNRIKAVEGGAVSVLIELLLETTDKRINELILVVLDLLCGCAEGRSGLLEHGAGLAIVSKKILRVSHVGSDRAVRVLSSICRFSANARVLQEMLQVGMVAKLCLVLQVEASLKSKERAKEMLKLHSRVWRNSPCIPPHLIPNYPS